MSQSLTVKILPLHGLGPRSPESRFTDGHRHTLWPQLSPSARAPRALPTLLPGPGSVQPAGPSSRQLQLVWAPCRAGGRLRPQVGCTLRIMGSQVRRCSSMKVVLSQIHRRLGSSVMCFTCLSKNKGSSMAPEQCKNRSVTSRPLADPADALQLLYSRGARAPPGGRARGRGSGRGTRGMGDKRVWKHQVNGGGRRGRKMGGRGARWVGGAMRPEMLPLAILVTPRREHSPSRP